MLIKRKENIQKSLPHKLFQQQIGTMAQIISEINKTLTHESCLVKLSAKAKFCILWFVMAQSQRFVT